jgi:subtilisin family serine protease
MRIIVLGVPAGMSAIDALNTLRTADPDGTYEFNHIYDPSASELNATSEPSAPATIVNSPRGQGFTIGVIDSGVDETHPSLRQARIITANMVHEGAGPPTAHGTAVASLLVGSGVIGGAVPEATLYLADVFGGVATGGAAETIIRGLSWLARQNVPVINVNLVGPNNRLLEAAIDAVSARGILVVAAVGNTGPASPVGFPAAYDNVIAVTSVDQNKSIQVDANRGPEVEFSAYGVDVIVAALSGGYGRATGTSFAAPLVAARFAIEIGRPAPQRVAQTRRALQYEALDLGVPGRDPVYGYGFLDLTSTFTASASKE